MGEFEVVVAAGTLRSTGPDAVQFPHRWTDLGVSIEAPFSGAHLLHVAVAGCVLNDVYREAEGLGVPVDGVKVTASGDYDRESWHSTGIVYDIEIYSPADPDVIAELLDVVDAVAEIPKAIRAGASVVRG